MSSATSRATGDRRWLILVVVAIAQLMVVLDSTIVNIALPSAQHALGFPNNDRQWVVTAYALAFGSLLLVGGRSLDEAPLLEAWHITQHTEARLLAERSTARIAREQSIGVLFTEHDMDVVFEHADRILVLNRGSLIAEGSPEDVRRNAEVRAIYLGEGLLYDARHREGAAP